MSRYRSDAVYEQLPRLAIVDGLNFVAGLWRGDIRKSVDLMYLKCGIRLTTFDDYNLNNPCWLIRIERKRVVRRGRRVVQPSFEATIAFNTSGLNQPSSQSIVLMRGNCRTWEEAIEALSYAPIEAMVRKLAANQYRGKWVALRPFLVTYPWDSWEEPNAKYSPFRFKGEAFHPECEGAIGSTLDHDLGTARKIASDLGANAFLWGPRTVSTPGGDREEYLLYHRDGMRAYDVIDLDQWYARIIAGSGDD